MQTESGTMFVRVQRFSQITRTNWTASVSSGNIQLPGISYTHPNAVVPFWARSTLLPWLKLPEGSKAPPEVATINLQAMGWPWRSVYSFDDTIAARFTGLGKLRTFGLLQRFGIPRDFSMPYLPVWSGLVLNFSFYAAVWMLLFEGVAMLIAEARHRSRSCTACGYSLAGLTQDTCPECGETPEHDVTPPPNNTPDTNRS